MGELTFNGLRDRLSQGKIGGNYFLKAEDSFLRDEAIDLLTLAHLDDGSADFDLDLIDGEGVGAETLASRLETPPLLSPHRVVVIRSAQSLTPSARAVVERAVQGASSGRVLIVSAELPKSSKAKFYNVLQKNCTVVSLRAPRPSELPGWLVTRAQAAYGVKFDTAAAQLLAQGIGARLGILARELDKLVTYVSPRSEIGVEEVRAAAGALPQVDRWEWVDRALDREFESAVTDVPALLDTGENAVGLISALSEAFLRVGLARAGDTKLAEVLKRDGSYGYLRWKIPVYARQARGWTEAEIDSALAELLRADRLVKSGGLTDRAALQEVLLRIAVFASQGRRN